MKKPQDDKEAVKFQRLYAEKGVVNAQFRLAQMYYEGLGVEHGQLREAFSDVWIKTNESGNR